MVYFKFCFRCQEGWNEMLLISMISPFFFCMLPSFKYLDRDRPAPRRALSKESLSIYRGRMVPWELH